MLQKPVCLYNCRNLDPCQLNPKGRTTMEICTATCCVSNSPPRLRPFTSYRDNLPWKKFRLSPMPNPMTRNDPGLLNYNNSSLDSTSEKTSNEANQYVKEPDCLATVVEVQSEKSGLGGFDLMKDDAPMDDQFPQFDFLNNLRKELDFEDSFSVVLAGGGGLAVLWLTASIAGAIDNIPLLPKLLELMGLGYTIWFTTRYLLFKKNRDELGAKIDEIKQRVLGPTN